MSKHLTPQYLTERLQALPSAGRYWVAYSGGPDSHALLHALAAANVRRPILAIHVDHGLHDGSGAWVEHCRMQCEQLSVPFFAQSVNLQERAGQSVEALAREHRYDAIAERIESGDMVLTGHTGDDQAETLLLQLLRGAGPSGLACMPECTRFAAGWLARPLLGVGRTSVEAYVRRNRLRVVVDPSNDDERYDRNFVRHQVMPLLLSRWPATTATLTRVASHQAQASTLLREMARQDLAAQSMSSSAMLSVSYLCSLEPARRHNVIREWIRDNGFDVPASQMMVRLEREVLEAAADRVPMLRWGHTQLRRYRDSLYLMCPLSQVHNQSLVWSINTPIELPHGVLSANPVVGRGIAAAKLVEGEVTVRLRTGSQRCRPTQRQRSQTLKKLFQEAHVPPWVRNRIPLIYIDNTLAAVTGYWICAPFEAGPGCPGWEPVWQDGELGQTSV